MERSGIRVVEAMGSRIPLRSIRATVNPLSRQIPLFIPKPRVCMIGFQLSRWT